MHHITQTSRAHWLLIATVILFMIAMVCGLARPFGQALSDDVGMILLSAAIICATIARC